jgi:hypothetical protein
MMMTLLAIGTLAGVSLAAEGPSVTAWGTVMPPQSSQSCSTISGPIVDQAPADVVRQTGDGTVAFSSPQCATTWDRTQDPALLGQEMDTPEKGTSVESPKETKKPHPANRWHGPHKNF